jgi:hypothetical protein
VERDRLLRRIAENTEFVVEVSVEISSRNGNSEI